MLIFRFFLYKEKRNWKLFFFPKILSAEYLRPVFVLYYSKRRQRKRKKIRCCADVQQFTVLHIERNFFVVFILLCFQEIETRISGPSRHKFLYNNTHTSLLVLAEAKEFVSSCISFFSRVFSSITLGQVFDSLISGSTSDSGRVWSRPGAHNHAPHPRWLVLFLFNIV
jgi:hypothetical protein